MALTVQREELTPLHKEWAALLDQVPEPVPFVHPTWQRVWLEEFQGDREVLLYTARDGDSLVGVAPLMRENGRLSLIGHYSMCDYMDFVVAPDRAGEFYPAILEALLEETELVEQYRLDAGRVLVASPELTAKRLDDVIGRNGHVRGAPLEQTEHRGQHPGGCGDLSSARVLLGRQGEVVPEQLVGAVDEMSFHAGTITLRPLPVSASRVRTHPRVSSCHR